MNKCFDVRFLTLVEPYAHATNTRFWDILGHRFHFNGFPTAHTNKVCMRFRFDILSKAFSNRCLYDENAQRITISLDGRPIRIELYAFSNELALVCVDWA